MNELIPIRNHEGRETVNARELHFFLNVKSQFNNWIKNYVKKFGFIENDDFVIIYEKSSGRPTKEYYVSLDMAKELSMVSRSVKGKEARLYFIDCERRLKSVESRPNSIGGLTEKDINIITTIVSATVSKTIETLDGRMQNLESRINDNQLLLPDVPEMSKRALLRKLVNDHADNQDVHYPHVWNQLYQEIYYRKNINVKVRAKNEGIKTLDYIDNNDLMDDAISIAMEVF